MGISRVFLDILKFQFCSKECVWSRGGLRTSVCSSVFLGGYQWLALSLWNIYQPVLCLNDRVRIPCFVMKPGQGRGREEKRKMDCWDSKGEIMKKGMDNPKERDWAEWERGRDDRTSHSSVNPIPLCHSLFPALHLCQNIASIIYIHTRTRTRMYAHTHTRTHTHPHSFFLCFCK